MHLKSTSNYTSVAEVREGKMRSSLLKELAKLLNDGEVESMRLEDVLTSKSMLDQIIYFIRTGEVVERQVVVGEKADIFFIKLDKIGQALADLQTCGIEPRDYKPIDIINGSKGAIYYYGREIYKRLTAGRAENIQRSDRLNEKKICPHCQGGNGIIQTSINVSNTNFEDKKPNEILANDETNIKDQKNIKNSKKARHPKHPFKNEKKKDKTVEKKDVSFKKTKKNIKAPNNRRRQAKKPITKARDENPDILINSVEIDEFKKGLEQYIEEVLVGEKVKNIEEIFKTKEPEPIPYRLALTYQPAKKETTQKKYEGIIVPKRVKSKSWLNWFGFCC